MSTVQDSGRSPGKVSLKSLSHVRVVAQPLHDLLVLDLIDQCVRGLFIRRVKNETDIVSDATIRNQARLTLHFFNSSIFVQILLVIND